MSELKSFSVINFCGGNFVAGLSSNLLLHFVYYPLNQVCVCVCVCVYKDTTKFTT